MPVNTTNIFFRKAFQNILTWFQINGLILGVDTWNKQDQWDLPPVTLLANFNKSICSEVFLLRESCIVDIILVTVETEGQETELNPYFLKTS